MRNSHCKSANTGEKGQEKMWKYRQMIQEQQDKARGERKRGIWGRRTNWKT